MTGTSGIHVEVLDDHAERALREHARAADALGFYLAGGTALALQLGHRRSVDFDWFRGGEAWDPLALAAELEARNVPLLTVSTAQDTLHAQVAGVRASFFRYRYPLLDPLVEWSESDCRLAATRDIAAMKLAAVAQRGARKDFYDVVAIGRSGLELPAMIEAYRSKFSVRDIAHVLTALTWFEDAERDPEPISLSGETWNGVKETVRAWVKTMVG